MRRNLFLFFMAAGFLAAAQNNPESSNDAAEVRLTQKQQPYDLLYQQELREQEPWQQFLAEHGEWYVHFNESSALPHRAYGTPIAASGSTPEEMAMNFIAENLTMFNLPESELELPAPPINGKYTWVNFRQVHQGIPVLHSRVAVKLFGNAVVLFGCDAFSNMSVDITPTLTASEALAAASSGITNEILGNEITGGLKILPVPGNRFYSFHLVYECMVKTQNANGVPANYVTYVDAHNGQVLMRTNTVHHICDHACDHEPKLPPNPAALPVLDSQVYLVGDVYPFNPYENVESFPLVNLLINCGGDNYYTDETGFVNITEIPGAQAQVRLMGLWSRVYTDGITPGYSFNIATGDNNEDFNSNSNIKERCAYKGVNEIHDHCKFWLPDFTGMDFQLPTNVDVAGECNAFYDGESINFYTIGGGCNATSQIADVVYHEYGHGINDKFYESIGGNFVNGAMGEGYADYWAISLTNNPHLGQGFYTDSEDGIRRYDLEPAVYPMDLTGEVHADGEIIMGAWWDTHLLLESDWDITMPIFLEAYEGLQAETPGGQEGQAYTDVLIDALMADDNDGNISNGTPHSAEIIEGFAIHGITLLSNATLFHNDIEFASDDVAININATLDLDFDFISFLESASLHYRLNDATVWTQVTMSNIGGESYQAVIPGQPKGTIIYYYLSTLDIFGNISNVQPIAASLDPYPNLPNIILVGVEAVGIHDCDDNEDWGAWDEGVSGDNAGTGLWVFDEPVGSYGTDGQMVQIAYQHTPGGEYCFITGNAGEAEGIGTNDVDDGKTTLQTAEIDLTEYDNPIIAYWRFYTNSPPSGANPGADWWHVRLSDDGGSTWTYIENNKTDDLSWRRNAFRVLDYAEATDEVLMQFIASDSTHIGEYLDGGSLIEAAVDDFVIYDDAVEPTVDEISSNASFDIFPNPATTFVWIDVELKQPAETSFILFNALGEAVAFMESQNFPSGNNRLRLPLTNLSNGIYLLKMSAGNETTIEKITVN